MSVEKIPSPPHMGRSIIQHDPQSRSFPARGVLMEPSVPRRTRSWRRSYPYDQGNTSSCAGQTFKGILNTGPLSANVPHARRYRYDAYDFYAGGQLHDEWPGAEPDYEGTSALGVCKYLATLGLIEEYRWCFGVDDVIDTIVQHGPVGIGVWWHADMENVDQDGFVRASGDKIGGHEVELHGVNVRGEYVIGTNSWGRGWGTNGHFKLTWADLDSLLQDDGDAVTVVN